MKHSAPKHVQRECRCTCSLQVQNQQGIMTITIRNELSLPNHILWILLTSCSNKARLDRFWVKQDVKYDLTADLTGIGDRSMYE